MLLKDAVTAYQKNYSGKDPSTITRLNFWLEHLGNFEVKDISALDIDDAICILIQQPAKSSIRKKVGVDEFGKNIYEIHSRNLDRPKANATLNRYISSLGSVLRFIKTKRLIRGFISPIRGVEKFKESQGKVAFLTEVEIEILIAASRECRWKKLPCLIKLAFITGVRKSTLKAIRWQDIDWKHQTITFPITKNGEPHTAPLNDSCVDELKRIYSELSKAEDLVFCGKFSNKAHDFTSSYITLIERHFPDRGLTFHSLRHSCCSHLAKNGAPLPVMASWMAHKSLRMVSRYAHIVTTDREHYLRSCF